jgi:hypothetical protein
VWQHTSSQHRHRLSPAYLRTCATGPATRIVGGGSKSLFARRRKDGGTAAGQRPPPSSSAASHHARRWEVRAAFLTKMLQSEERQQLQLVRGRFHR